MKQWWKIMTRACCDMMFLPFLSTGESVLTSSCSSLWTLGDRALILWVFLALAVGVGEGVTGSRDFFSFSCSEISALWASSASLSKKPTPPLQMTQNKHQNKEESRNRNHAGPKSKVQTFKIGTIWSLWKETELGRFIELYRILDKSNL